MTDEELGQDKVCFIVGPIGDRLAPLGSPGKTSYENAIQIWEAVFEPACKTFGMSPVRADKISESGDINEQIFTYLRDADVVIADLTGGNANVMYELGLRHTREKITIQIGENERLPFDVTTIRTIKFVRTEAGLIEARNGLIEALRTALTGGGSPVTATRVWSEVGALSAESIAEAAALSTGSEDPIDDVDPDGPGTLEMLVRGEASLETISSIIEDFVSQLEGLTAVAGDYGPQLKDAESFASRLAVVRHFADALKPTSDNMETTSAEFVSRVLDVDAFVRILAEQLDDALDGEDAEAAATFVEAVSTLGAAAAEANVSMVEVLAVVRQMRTWSSMLKPISKSLERSINAIVSGSNTVASWRDLLEGARGDEAAE